jgi:hypothetical protein
VTAAAVTAAVVVAGCLALGWRIMVELRDIDDLAARLAVLQAEVDRGTRTRDNRTYVGLRLCIGELVSKWPAYVGPLPVEAAQ